jgi:predicted esterase
LAKEYDFIAAGHPNIYTGDSREFKIFFSEPESGVNENTGIVLLIAGYGGHAEANVYKKMRRKFADEHNLVCVQCHYFGYEFMQLEFLQETIENFNDMSVMQAMDNLTALLMVIAIIKDNNLNFNTKRIIAYGNSHGAYLAHLCNVYAPDLFSLLIDNAGYMYPMYLVDNHTRYLNVKNKEGENEKIDFRYIAKRKSLKMERELIDLNMLYKNFENKCSIVTFQWVNDHIVDATEKKKFL